MVCNACWKWAACIDLQCLREFTGMPPRRFPCTECGEKCSTIPSTIECSGCLKWTHRYMISIRNKYKSMLYIKGWRPPSSLLVLASSDNWGPVSHLYSVFVITVLVVIFLVNWTHLSYSLAVFLISFFIAKYKYLLYIKYMSTSVRNNESSYLFISQAVCSDRPRTHGRLEGGRHAVLLQEVRIHWWTIWREENTQEVTPINQSINQSLLSPYSEHKEIWFAVTSKHVKYVQH